MALTFLVTLYPSIVEGLLGMLLVFLLTLGACAGVTVVIVCVCVCVCVCVLASYPGSLGGGESLGTTACACANLTRKTW